MIRTFTFMGCSQALLASNPTILTLLLETFHLSDRILRFSWNNSFSNFLVSADHNLDIMQNKIQIISWLCHFNDRYFFLLPKRKVYFIVLARISYLGNFIPIFPSIIMLLLIIHLIYNFLSVVLLLPDPVFRSYSTNNA